MASNSRRIKISYKRQAKNKSAFFSNANIRKRVYASTLATLAVKDFLQELALTINEGEGHSDNFFLAEAFDIADIKINNARLDVRCNINKEFTQMWIPKNPIKFGYVFDFYLGVTLNTSTERADIVGFLSYEDIKNIIKNDSSTGNYYIIEAKQLRPVEELFDAIVPVANFEKAATSINPAEHDIIQELFTRFLDNDLTLRESKFFEKHILNCDSCREILSNLYLFERTIKEVKYTQIFIDENFDPKKAPTIPLDTLVSPKPIAEDIVEELKEEAEETPIEAIADVVIPDIPIETTLEIATDGEEEAVSPVSEEILETPEEATLETILPEEEEKIEVVEDIIESPIEEETEVPPEDISFETLELSEETIESFETSEKIVSEEIPSLIEEETQPEIVETVSAGIDITEEEEPVELSWQSSYDTEEMKEDSVSTEEALTPSEEEMKEDSVSTEEALTPSEEEIKDIPDTELPDTPEDLSTPELAYEPADETIDFSLPVTEDLELTLHDDLTLLEGTEELETLSLEAPLELEVTPLVIPTEETVDKSEPVTMEITPEEPEEEPIISLTPQEAFDEFEPTTMEITPEEPEEEPIISLTPQEAFDEFEPTTMEITPEEPEEEPIISLTPQEAFDEFEPTTMEITLEEPEEEPIISLTPQEAFDEFEPTTMEIPPEEPEEEAIISLTPEEVLDEITIEKASYQLDDLSSSIKGVAESEPVLDFKVPDEEVLEFEPFTDKVPEEPVIQETISADTEIPTPPQAEPAKTEEKIKAPTSESLLQNIKNRLLKQLEDKNIFTESALAEKPKADEAPAQETPYTPESVFEEILQEAPESQELEQVGQPEEIIIPESTGESTETEEEVDQHKKHGGRASYESKLAQALKRHLSIGKQKESKHEEEVAPPQEQTEAGFYAEKDLKLSDQYEVDRDLALDQAIETFEYEQQKEPVEEITPPVEEEIQEITASDQSTYSEETLTQEPVYSEMFPAPDISPEPMHVEPVMETYSEEEYPDETPPEEQKDLSRPIEREFYPEKVTPIWKKRKVPIMLAASLLAISGVLVTATVIIPMISSKTQPAKYLAQTNVQDKNVGTQKAEVTQPPAETQPNLVGNSSTEETVSNATSEDKLAEQTKLPANTTENEKVANAPIDKLAETKKQVAPATKVSGAAIAPKAPPPLTKDNRKLRQEKASKEKSEVKVPMGEPKVNIPAQIPPEPTKKVNKDMESLKKTPVSTGNKTAIATGSLKTKSPLTNLDESTNVKTQSVAKSAKEVKPKQLAPKKPDHTQTDATTKPKRKKIKVKTQERLIAANAPSPGFYDLEHQAEAGFSGGRASSGPSPVTAAETSKDKDVFTSDAKRLSGEAGSKSMRSNLGYAPPAIAPSPQAYQPSAKPAQSVLKKEKGSTKDLLANLEEKSEAIKLKPNPSHAVTQAPVATANIIWAPLTSTQLSSEMRSYLGIAAQKSKSIINSEFKSNNISGHLQTILISIKINNSKNSINAKIVSSSGSSRVDNIVLNAVRSSFSGNMPTTSNTSQNIIEIKLTIVL